jgi:seryl-tRNA synthetase
MIDLKDLRENPDKYRRGAELKNIPVDIDTLLRLDEQHSFAQRQYESLRAEQNRISQQIGKTKDPSERESLKSQAAEFKPKLAEAQEQSRQAEEQLLPLLLQIPQPPDDDVPVGKDASDNVVDRKVGTPRQFSFQPKNHIELGESLGLFDFSRGVRIAGSRSYYLTGQGAQLHNAILQLALSMMVNEKGFTLLNVPVLVRECAMQGTGFFPAGREQTYHVAQDELFLTGTAEVGLTAFHMDEILPEKDLPKKYTAVSTCFRREAGTYGKDTAGLYRVHQFDKCEQVVICRNDVEESKRWHAEMLSYSEELLKRLELPYRVIRCCTGDIGVKNASMFDIETWMPGRVESGKPDSGYGETHSASRLYEFQSRRLNLRYKDEKGKVRFCHTLNNTVVASPRILIPLLENHQNQDGSINIPTALRPFMGGLDQVEKHSGRA